MATTRALQRNIKISARKAGLVCDLVRFKKATTALNILENTDKKFAPFVLKLLRSAMANATNNHNMSTENLYIQSIVANQGPTAKRTMPRAKGSADIIRKRTTHLEIILSDEPKKVKISKNSKKADTGKTKTLTKVKDTKKEGNGGKK
jgi:large subunit ribosomal protein L22